MDAELLYTAEFDGRTHVVYNGWPLFYFVRDEQPGQIDGQEVESFGGEWYIVGPDGTKVEGEHAGEGSEAERSENEGGDAEGSDAEYASND